MIQVLLFILKIIGIVLLVVLGLILLILALVLFVPVFYRVKIVHNPEKTLIKARVSFLFPLLLVTVQYLKKLSYKVRIFGIALLDSDKPKKEKRKSKKKKSTGKKTRAEAVKKTEPESNEEPVLPKATESKPGSEPEPEQIKQKVVEAKSEKNGFFKKIRRKIQKVRDTICNIVNKIKRVMHQKDEVQRILAKPETKRALKFAWDKLKRLLKHILPRKMKGYVAYGAEDPATTGQVLGGIGVVYAKTGQLLEIRPNFEEKQLECDVELKGQIQVFTLLVIAVKVFMNQELRQLITEFKNIKEIK